MSPEQAQGLPVDARSDIFSLGAVLYEMLAGQRPFAGSSPAALITAILRDQPPPMSAVRGDVPPVLEPIVARALAKDPANRYPNAATVRADLDAAHARLTRPPDAAWRRPAVLIYSDILQLSNFDNKGPDKAGARAGLGPWGTLDMAGNVKEWCANDVAGRPLRYILGGGWNEPSYRFGEQDAQDPWLRRATHGVRLVRNLGHRDPRHAGQHV